MSNAIVRSVSSATSVWQAVEFTSDRMELMKRHITPQTATEAEFAYFVDWCQQTGLNPFLKQAFLIERWDRATNAKKHEPMVAEAGFAARADALPDFRGMRSGVVYLGDKFSIDETTQEIQHVWSPVDRVKAGNKIIGAWAHGKREGRVSEITWLPIEARIQTVREKQSGEARPTRFWATDPAGMIRKCARADQYRRLYPNIFAGWYDTAEATDTEPAETPAVITVSRTASVAEKVAAKAAQGRAQVLPIVTPPKQVEQPKAVAPVPLAQERQKGLVVLGTLKDKRIIELTAEELAKTLEEHRSAEAKATHPDHQKRVKEGLAELNDEMSIRAKMAAEEGAF